MQQLMFRVVINGNERKMWFTSQKALCRWAMNTFEDDKVRSLLITDENNNIFFDNEKAEPPAACLACEAGEGTA